MKLRPLPVAILALLVAALLIMASGLAAQEGPASFPLTATALAGGGSSPAGTATITPLPSLTPGGVAVATSTPGSGVPSLTPLPSLTPGQRASVTPLPSLTPVGQTAPTQPPTEPPTASATPAPSLTPLPSLTPEGAAAVAGSEGTPSGEAQLEATAEDAAAEAGASNLAPINIVVPSVSPAQEAPSAPASAAGVGTLILLIGLGGATVVGLLMLARDRYREHGDE